MKVAQDSAEDAQAVPPSSTSSDEVHAVLQPESGDDALADETETGRRAQQSRPSQEQPKLNAQLTSVKAARSPTAALSPTHDEGYSPSTRRDSSQDDVGITKLAADTVRLARQLPQSLALNLSRKKRNPHAIRKHLTGVDKLLVNAKGHMTLRDQHLDVFSRYCYPLCYCIVLAIFLGTAERVQ